ncbi:MAG: pseudaminic acid synthase [Rhodospirillaceae bacterium]|jgi:pseudaminic acid synthase|nr:pseudaminic acid synthase [Rhodospirillaceae bacterium]MBT5665259.1 pseudaminic acid synthase [Rhodospirillaceae bacterium]MBT5812531.1 pseudaminic acid synthase [Rhodospirillaceae bacterium]
MKDNVIEIDGRRIGPGYRPYIVAEMSANHNGTLEGALAIVDAAKAAGADAVKMQTYTADTITIDHDAPQFLIKGGLWDGRRLHELYEEAHTPWDWHEPIFRRAKELGITIFSAPFDLSAVDLLESLGAPAYKIASFELVDIPLVERVAATGKPVILSTGMANLDEIEDAVLAARGAGDGGVLLLHCVSGYPAPAEESNLRTIAHLRDTFDCVVGLSDHTLGAAVAVASVAFSASLIEKHFTINRKDGGLDSTFSLEPSELKTLVADAHTAWAASGSVDYAVKSSERENRGLRRSLYVVKEIAEGEIFTIENVRSIRPGGGLAPKHLPDILGKHAQRRLERGDPLDWLAVNPA